MKIITHYDYPPIPIRGFDWSAVLDSYDGSSDSKTRGQIGHGATEQEAIDDLKEILDWCERCDNDGELPNGDICPDCCPHDEHDHGICLDCHKDIWDDVVAAAEFRADCMEDR